MKKTLSTLFVLILFLNIGFSQNKAEKKDRQFPSFIQVSENIAPSKSEGVFRKHFHLESTDELRQLDTRTDELGFHHQRYQQYYQGIPVEGGVVAVHALDGVIQTVTGNYFNVFDLEVRPTLSKEQGLQAALDAVNATSYIWEDEDEHEHGLPEAELVVVGQIKGWIEEPHLAYKFDIYATAPLMRANVFVDAHTGEFITAHQRIHHTDAPANGNSLYNGNVSFTADFTGSNYRLRQAGSGGGVQTFTLNNGTNYGSASDITSSTSNFGNANQTAVQAHYGAEQTYDYFFSEHGRNSYNGTGGVLRSYVSYSSNYVNAFWDGSRMTYGDGDGVNYGPLVSLDITGHEIAHGVTEFSANLVYQRESGALNESFSDIFGEMVEFHASGSNNWQMGTDIGIGGSGALRSMNNPNAFGDPDTYGGTYWTNPNCGTPTQSNDYCGVHSNSGVQNKWFYILAVGESGTNDIGNSYNVTGIGRTAAGAIAYRNLANYLSTNSTFADARAGAIQAAVDLYGAGSAEEIATTNAWYAVGVGGEYGTISYCNSNGNNVNDEYIQRVQLNTVDNTSGSGGGYSNHLDVSTDLTKNASYFITVTPLWTGTVYAEGYSVWVDYNQDGDFTDAGEQVWTQAATTSTPVGGSFTIPGSALEGPTRMRVSMKYNGIPTACESFTYGEVEDYTVNIVTGGAPDTQAPTAPGSLSASGTTQTSTNLSWSASTDNVGVTGYNVYQDGINVGSVTGTSATVSGLSESSSYSFYVTAYDAVGNESTASNTANVTTNAAPDTQAPMAPGGLSASGTTQTNTNLSWSASTDNVGVTGYNVYQDGVNVGSVTGTSAAVSGLSAGTSYSFYVTAYDAAGNESAASNTANVTTNAAPDTQAPTEPGSLSASGTTQTSTTLSWSAASDNVGVTGYNVYQNGVNVASVAGTSTTVSGLSASTTYSFYVTAYDAAGNESGASNIVNVTTDTPSTGCNDNEVVISINLDNYPEETSWQITDAGGSVVASGGTYGSQPDGSNVSETLCLVDGCYDFTIFDTYGDGICCAYGTGDYSVTSGGNTLASGGSFGSSETTNFCLGAPPAPTCDDGIQNGDETGVDCGGSSCPTCPPGGTDVLSGSYFETGWDGWSDGGSDCARYNGSFSYEGNYSIQIRDNSGTASAMTSPAFNLSSYDAVEVEFYFYANSMENGEDFWLRYYNGSTWQTVASYARGTSFNNNTFYTATVTLSSANYNLASNGQFRFQCDASTNSDQIYIDAVEIRGITGSGFLAGTIASGSSINELDNPTGKVIADETITISEEDVKDLMVYPNPAQDFLRIVMPEGEKVEQIRIFAANGALVKQLPRLEAGQRLDITTLSAGIYFLQVETIDGVRQQKFIKL